MIKPSAIFLALVLTLLPGARADDTDAAKVRAFLHSHCYDCHQGPEAEAGLQLPSLHDNLTEDATFAAWVRIFDRVSAGEMPPPDASDLAAADRSTFLQQLGNRLQTFQHQQHVTNGRVPSRRLTNLQLERTLHDLLGIDIPLAAELPAEPRTHGFTTVATGQPMSHYQLERHLMVVDRALDEAFQRAAGQDSQQTRDLPPQMLARRRARSRTREPELIDGLAVTWSGTLVFYGRLPATTPRESGWYRFRLKASALNPPADRGVWCTVRSGRCVSSAPQLEWITAFEATSEPREITFEAWLPAGHMLEIRPGDATLRKARFRGGQVGTGEGGPQNVPGVALHDLSMQRIHRGPGNAEIRRRLFGDIEIDRRWDSESGAFEILADPEQPRAAATRLVRSFARRAFRRPVTNEDLAPFVSFAHAALDRGEPLASALRGGYRAVLCSPRFLYFVERPGPLDSHALANRLSYFLWNTLPDKELRQQADSGALTDPAVLRQQTERMLSDSRGQTFVRDFAAEWLDLSEIDFTQPDRRMFPTFDAIVQQSMLQETHTYLQRLLDENRSVTELIDADYTFLNSRLARFYGVPGVAGDQLQRVSLERKSHRGGLLTQGAILKVTANGTTTSPVLRGVWVSERLLGEEIPPPPKGVPAIEPDVRGATTIREMLERHKSDPSCASCHIKIDPPGFALESFDPAGLWRDNYRQGRRKKGPRVNTTGTLPDGRRFEGIDSFRDLIESQPRTLARNLAEKLVTWGTGGPVTFADRSQLDAIVESSNADGYRVRSIVHAVIDSPLFRNK